MPLHSAVLNPQPVTGSVAVENQVNALVISGSITGLLVGGQPVSSLNPLPITGSITIATVPDLDAGGVSGSLPISASFAGFIDPGGLLQGAHVDNFGSLIVTGSVGIAGVVDTRQASAIAVVSFVTSSAVQSITFAVLNTARLGLTIYNDTNKILYLKLGTSASLNDYTTQLAKDDYYELPFGYTGRIDGISQAVATGVVRVTELT